MAYCRKPISRKRSQASCDSQSKVSILKINISNWLS